MDLEFQRINEFYLSLVRSSATFVYTTFFFFFFFYFICKYNELMRRNEMRKIPRTTITWQNGKDTVTKRAIQRNIKAERGKEILKQSG